MAIKTTRKIEYSFLTEGKKREAMLAIWAYTEGLIAAAPARSVELRAKDGSASDTEDLQAGFDEMAADLAEPVSGWIYQREFTPGSSVRIAVIMRYYAARPLKLEVEVQGTDRGAVLEADDRIRRILGTMDEPLPPLDGPTTASTPRSDSSVPRGIPRTPYERIAPPVPQVTRSGSTASSSQGSRTSEVSERQPEPTPNLWQRLPGWVKVVGVTIGGILVTVVTGLLTNFLGITSP